VNTPVGLSVVFLNVLFEQLGVPLPAMPTLIVAGALAADGQLPALAVCALALGACLVGDSAWYFAGRIYGARVMRLLCRISLTPDICVSETQTSFERWGSKALIVAKFIPGLSMVAQPLAGATRMSLARFAVYSGLGSMLWIGAGLLIGVLLRSQIVRLLPKLASVGEAAVTILLVLFAAYIAFKWRERKRFHAALHMARISVHDLFERMRGERAPVVVDVRSMTATTLTLRRIPGALHVPVHEVGRHVEELPRDREIVFYCTCPNEASAAQAARLLMNHGFHRVRPLHGGLDAWIAAGYPVEDIPAAASAAATTLAPQSVR
jgi:membrane protein DedA with SNARE-associated domain/rhodanese-related sulfurtransferase